MTNPTCKRCEYEFKAALPEWMATALCDSCQDKVTTYIASSSGPRQAARRIRASRRLYAPAEVPTAGELLPCEVDFTPQPAPAYDRPETISESVERGEREAAARPGSLGFDG